MNKAERIDFLMSCSDKQRREYYDKVGRLFCLVCRSIPPNLHHLVGFDYPRTRQHRPVVPLCMEHHQGDTGFHSGRKTFEKRYFTQEEMFEMTERLIERMD